MFKKNPIILFLLFIFFASSGPSFAEPPIESIYHIEPEDILEISVWKEDGLQKEVLVRPDGGLSFPLVGDVKVVGKSVDELRIEIRKRLSKYIASPVVTVSVIKIGGNKVYVIGKVNNPGEFVAGRYVDVMQALSMAGGLTPFAKQSDIKILRRKKNRIGAIKFDYGDILNGKNLTQNILLKNGDVVVVP